MVAAVINQLFAKVKTKLQGNAPTATNATHVGGLTVDGVRSSVTKADIGLGNVPNYTTASLTEAVNINSSIRFMTPLGVDGYVKSRLPYQENALVAADAAGSNGTFGNGTPVEFVSVIESDAELAIMQGVSESFENVWNRWKKISRGNWKSGNGSAQGDPLKVDVGLSDNAVPTDLEGLSYNATLDTIESSIDSRSMIGLISPEGFEDYVLDVTLKSNSTWQNDPLGLVLGYVVDANGDSHTLTVFRNPWGAAYSELANGPGGNHSAFQVCVNYNTDQGLVIANNNTGLLWVNGDPATGPYPTVDTQVAKPWAIKPWDQAPNGIRLRVTRSGDTFTIETTNYDETVFVPEATITFTLNDHAQLAKFKGPCRYGFATISQDFAVWEVNQRPGARSAIIDTRDWSTQLWDGSAWVGGGASEYQQYLTPGRFIHNVALGNSYYVEGDRLLVKF